MSGKLYAITVAFCPAAQLARTLMLYQKGRSICPDRHVVILGHYPINSEKNNRDIRMIAEAAGVELLDPGQDLGSAQSQWWALQQLGAQTEDYWINVDPDSNCVSPLWDRAMVIVLDADPKCVVITCMSPMVEKFMGLRNSTLEMKEAPIGYGLSIEYGIPSVPTPFNLSMWRYSFFEMLGCIPQMGPMWGEVEAMVYAHSKALDMYHAFLPDYWEEESGKLMSDPEKLKWQDLHMRTDGPDQFVGNLKEYLSWKHPEKL